MTVKFEKMSVEEEDQVIVNAGHMKYSVKQLKEEMSNSDSDFGRKLNKVKAVLDEYY